MNRPHYPANVQKMLDAVLNQQAESSQELRQDVEAFGAACSGSQRAAVKLPEDLRPYLEKVSKHAYKVTDNDVQQIKAAGYSEDEIFELTVCAALGSGLARLEKTLAL
ncbi:hypothetical protein MNBD_CHLOROFLEXI01-1860, partial [hydrothermal vent metagenome]